jgi:collagen type VII alpha
MTIVSTSIKAIVSLVVVAALVATRFSSSSNVSNIANECCAKETTGCKTSVAHTKKSQWIFLLESRCLSSEECLSLTYSVKFNRQRQPSHCNSSSTQASSKNNKMTRTSNLKGSRNLQSFSGGIVSGTATGQGTGTGSGFAQNLEDEEYGVTDGTGAGGFTSTSGSSGFIDSAGGTANGSAAGGATGSNGGNAKATLGGVQLLSFDGTTEAIGTGSFGGGISPVGFNTVVTEIPGEAYEGTSGSPKKGGSTGGGVSPSTFVTTMVPVSTGPTGGFGAGTGNLEIESFADGASKSDEYTEIGVSSSLGEATTFGGGMAQAQTFFGSASGLGSGAATGYTEASGAAKYQIDEYATFNAAAETTGTFNNVGTGIFGQSGALSFP